MIRRLLSITLMAAALAACAPAAAATNPPINPTDIEATALALANSMLAQTPSFGGASTAPPFLGATPEPTNGAAGTPVPVTGLSGAPVTPVPVTGLSGATATGLPGTVDCNHPLDVAAAGTPIRVAIRNQSRGAVTFSLGLASPNTTGQCGFVSLQIPRLSKAVTQVPETQLGLGDTCYWASAAISNRTFQETLTGKDFCLRSGLHWIFLVDDTQIRLVVGS